MQAFQDGYRSVWWAMVIGIAVLALVWLAGNWYDLSKDEEVNRNLQYWICGHQATAFTECEKVHVQ